MTGQLNDTLTGRRLLSSQDVTAITVGYNDSETVRTCVDGALDAGVARVVVWDNSDLPHIRDRIFSLSSNQVSVASAGRNLGFGGGNNAAFASVSTPLVLFINPDCLITADALLSLISIFESESDVGIVAPLMVYPDGERGFAGGGRPSLTKEMIAQTGIDRFLPRRLRTSILQLLSGITRIVRPGSGSLAESLQRGAPIEMHWVSGFCALMPSDVFREVDGFDERFFLYFEDVDICERVSGAGYRVILDRRTEAKHAESTSTDAAGKPAHYWRGLATYFETSGRVRRAKVARRMAARSSR